MLLLARVFLREWEGPGRGLGRLAEERGIVVSGPCAGG